METLSIAQCRKLIDQPFRSSLGDGEIEQLRNMLYSLADVVSDAYMETDGIDQSAFEPPGDPTGRFEKKIADFIALITREEAQ